MTTRAKPGSIESTEALDRAFFARWTRWLAPWHRLLDPVFAHFDRFPDERPLLLVGNHSIFGVLDVPLLIRELYQRYDVIVRPLGDHLHFRLPLWRQIVARSGTVHGTRENCARLMERGETILVFPGGGREVAKRRGEEYELIWKSRMGFARLAIAHGCTIVPFGAVGVEDAFRVVVDSSVLEDSALGRWLRGRGVRTDVYVPIAVGTGQFGLPRLQRLYFGLGAPIDTKRYDGDARREHCLEVRALTERAVRAQIEELRAMQHADPRRYDVPRAR